MMVDKEDLVRAIEDYALEQGGIEVPDAEAKAIADIVDARLFPRPYSAEDALEEMSNAIGWPDADGYYAGMVSLTRETLAKWRRVLRSAL